MQESRSFLGLGQKDLRERKIKWTTLVRWSYQKGTGYYRWFCPRL